MDHLCETICDQSEFIDLGVKTTLSKMHGHFAASIFANKYFAVSSCKCERDMQNSHCTVKIESNSANLIFSI